MDKIIEWQLQVTDDVLNGTGNHIHGNAKIHCYLNGNSLCSPKYWMVPQHWETTDFGEKDIDANPEYFCKKCVKKFKKLKESEGRQ
jgi:hypothetical protein